MISLSKLRGDITPLGHGGMQTVGNKPKHHFKYNHEWLKKVLNKECPDCEEQMTKKGIIRSCTNCTLKIYGSPMLVAYDKITIINPYYLVTKDHCPDCNGTEFEEIYKHGNTVCKSCGLVLAGPADNDIIYPWHLNFYDTEPKNQKKVFIQKN